MRHGDWTVTFFQSFSVIFQSLVKHSSASFLDSLFILFFSDLHVIVVRSPSLCPLWFPKRRNHKDSILDSGLKWGKVRSKNLVTLTTPIYRRAILLRTYFLNDVLIPAQPQICVLIFLKNILYICRYIV